MIPKFLARYLREWKWHHPILFGLAEKTPRQGHLFLSELSDIRGLLRGQRRLALFAIYQPTAPEFPAYLVQYIAELKAEGFFVIILAATDRKSGFGEQYRSFLGSDAYLERINKGFDFGSWGDFTRLLQGQGISLSQYSEVLLINDSVVGPFSPLAFLFRTLDGDLSAVQGLTDSLQESYHLQSYFLRFRDQALSTGFLDSFLANAPYFTDKVALIRRMEVGLHRMAIASGLKCFAAYPTEEFEPSQLGREELDSLRRRFGKERVLQPQNPTHFYANVLFMGRSFPFLKKELLTKNPEGYGFVDTLLSHTQVKDALRLIRAPHT